VTLLKRFPKCEIAEFQGELRGFEQRYPKSQLQSKGLGVLKLSNAGALILYIASVVIRIIQSFINNRLLLK